MAREKRKKASRRPAPATAAKRPAKASDSAGSDVERRWKEYWARRKQLEEAVEKVRAASEALKSAQEQEKNRRAEFDEIKRSLTKLLDVDPVGGPVREPILVARSLQETAPKQVG
jgi:hypothetical protein